MKRFIKRVLRKIKKMFEGNDFPVQEKAALQIPPGETLESIDRYLRSFTPEGARIEEMDGYLNESLRRFIYTLSLVPNGSGHLLEIGSNPYYMTLLLKKFRAYQVQSTNFFGEALPRSRQSQRVVNIANGDMTVFEFEHFNVESDEFPYPDGFFDVVLFCEVLEHLVLDPMFTLKNIHRVLKKDGVLIVTTPNVARYQNIERMLNGENIYDPYSGYGAYGRHNREYTRGELYRLLAQFGFTVTRHFTADSVSFQKGDLFENEIKRVMTRFPLRANDLGQYLFFQAKKSEAGIDEERKSWLFRSFEK